MSYRHVKTELVMLTPELAAKFAELGRGRGERPFSHERYSFLQNKLENGTFYPPRWRVAYIHSTKQTVRVDGQHSSKLLANCNGLFPAAMLVIVDRFDCDTEDDLEDLFNEFDSRRSTRTPRDIVFSAASRYENLDDINTRTVVRIINGLAYLRAIIENDAEPNARPFGVEQRAKLISHEQEFILFCAEFASSDMLKWDCVISAIYMTWMKGRDAARDFWREVRDESGDRGSQTRVLANFLRDIQSVNNDRKHPTNRRLVHSKCIHAWNARCENKPTILRYYHDSPTPEPVAP